MGLSKWNDPNYRTRSTSTYQKNVYRKKLPKESIEPSHTHIEQKLEKMKIKVVGLSLGIYESNSDFKYFFFFSDQSSIFSFPWPMLYLPPSSFKNPVLASEDVWVSLPEVFISLCFPTNTTSAIPISKLRVIVMLKQNHIILMDLELGPNIALGHVQIHYVLM